MDAFDVFGDGDSEPSSSSALLPRASEHPQFAPCRAFAPIPAATLPPLDGLEDFGAACAAALRKTTGDYGRSCAASLVDACAAYAAGDIPRAAAASRGCHDLTAVRLDESAWDAPCWQEAQLLSRAVQLACALRGAAPSEASVGALAVGMFNVAAVLATPLPPFVGPLFAAAEAAVVVARPPPAVADAAWRMPAAPAPADLPAMGGGTPIPVVRAADLTPAAFFSRALQPARPLLIKGHLHAQQWAALDYFADLRRLRDEHGGRLVPVNLGSPLVGYGGVEHMSLARLIDEHLLPSNASHGAPRPPDAAPDEEAACAVAYMSQHHLLHQCAPLQQLCALPPYTLGRPLHPLNVWLGTRGTVTSLHSDASENLLAQVAGHKYVRLYGLDQTPHLYASLQRGGAFGTSPVRVEAADLAAYPKFANAAYSEAILEPGDLLYIPKSMWHYLRALTTSTSINLWFD